MKKKNIIALIVALMAITTIIALVVFNINRHADDVVPGNNNGYGGENATTSPGDVTGEDGVVYDEDGNVITGGTDAQGNYIQPDGGAPGGGGTPGTPGGGGATGGEDGNAPGGGTPGTPGGNAPDGAIPGTPGGGTPPGGGDGNGGGNVTTTTDREYSDMH